VVSAGALSLVLEFRCHGNLCDAKAGDACAVVPLAVEPGYDCRVRGAYSVHGASSVCGRADPQLGKSLETAEQMYVLCSKPCAGCRSASICSGAWV
jgi:hypothetical protein